MRTQNSACRYTVAARKDFADWAYHGGFVLVVHTLSRAVALAAVAAAVAENAVQGTIAAEKWDAWADRFARLLFDSGVAVDRCWDTVEEIGDYSSGCLPHFDQQNARRAGVDTSSPDSVRLMEKVAGTTVGRKGQ